MPKLTPAQQRIIDVMRAYKPGHRWFHSIEWGLRHTTSFDRIRITEGMITALRRAGYIESRVIERGQPYPDGRINNLRVSRIIYVLKEASAVPKVRCPECDRVFDLSDPTDAAEWSTGHDCEVR